MSAPLFLTQRQRVLDAYKKAGQPFIASTLPYHSTRQLRFTIVDAETAAVTPFAFAVARPQVVNFFDYGIGDAIETGAADEDDTNLASGKSTNGASDFVIEGVGFGVKGVRVKYGNVAADFGAPADPDVVEALDGNAQIFDPGAIAAPPQVHSPFNLEDALLAAIVPHLSLEFEWDRRRTEKIGTVDVLPQAGAQSYLRANGVPASENRYRIPEGYLWRRDGQPDSEFLARVHLKKAVVVPIHLVETPQNGVVHAPEVIDVQLRMRLFGLEVDLPSVN